MKLPNLNAIDEIRKSGFRPGVVGCFLNNKKVLFLFKKEYDLWQLPQGGIDNEESIEEATIREMTEELGEEFVASMEINSLFGGNEIEFPPKTQNTRTLKTDAGEEIFMKGKNYFYIAINAKITELDIVKTEFDDCRWLDYGEAMELAETIYQRGKKRVTIDILKKLHSADLL